jgi:cell division protein FtsI/penicillin-binding protein 2
LEVNTETSVIATNGKLCLPGLVKGTTCKNLNIDQKNIDLVKQGMIGACSTGGTGYTFFDFKPQVACKTGTAETGAESDSHAWFTVFGPANDPQIVATVLVEKGGEGSKVAGPIATDIFKYWFGSAKNE